MPAFDGIKQFINKFDGGAFTRTWIGRRASRWLEEVFDQVGADNIDYCIKNQRNILNYIPEEMKQQWKEAVFPYREYADVFDNETLYSWLPEKWKRFIESRNGGSQWGHQLVVHIRQEFFNY